MTYSTKLITYTTLSYIHFSLYFIYLRCILFLNTIDHIIFSDMLTDNITKSSSNMHSNCVSSQQNSLNRHIKPTSTFSIFDINKRNLMNEHTRNEMEEIEKLVFSDN